MSMSGKILPERAPALPMALSHFLMGGLFLAALLLTLLRQAPLLAADYLHNPAALAVTHLFTLGFGGSVAHGAVYQIIPVMLHGRLRSERAVLVHLLLHGPGVLLMVNGFLQFETGWIMAGGSLVAAGALLFAWNAGATLRRVECWSVHGVWIAAALLFYLATVGWGLALAANQRYGFWPDIEAGPLPVHLALGLVGWFSLLIYGVGTKLVPMFGPSRPLPDLFVGGLGAATTLGVLLLVTGALVGDGTSSGQAMTWAGALLIAIAALAYAVGVAYSFRTRRHAPLDWSVRFAVTAAAVLVLVVLAAGVVSLLNALPGAPALAPVGHGDRPWWAALVYLFTMGWVGGTMLGMLLRIIPFKVWLHRFRNRLDRERLPFLHEMFRPALGWAAYLLWFAGASVTAGGIGLRIAWVIRSGAAVSLLAFAAFALAVGAILRHARPGTPPLYTARGKR